MNSDKPYNDKSTNANQEQDALNKIEEMWDRKLAKGDDEFFDVVERNPARDKKDSDQQAEQQPSRKRGKRK